MPSARSRAGPSTRPWRSRLLAGWGVLPSTTAIWMYLVANFLGGAFAGFAFNNLNPDDK